ncbi:MAG: GNAT family N-acetyltransferase, partial [Candidatus Eisenbacteria sp.]|nr:GNAT family N-acetyltransferase [Candidatus Eisenbacteria bacterium]
MIISGHRVCLRDVCASDLEDYKRWFTPGKPWQAWDAPWENTKENLARFRVQLLKRLQEPPPDPRTRLEIETAEGRHLGWVTSCSADQHTHGRECGIDIAEEGAWGQGLGREALTLWVGYLFSAHGLSRVGLGTWSGNERMIRLAARIGMREEARFAAARQFAGHIYDGVRWGVTREEWERYEAPCSNGLRRYTPVDWELTVELTRQLYQHHRSLQRGPAFT